MSSLTRCVFQHFASEEDISEEYRHMTLSSPRPREAYVPTCDSPYSDSDGSDIIDTTAVPYDAILTNMTHAKPTPAFVRFEMCYALIQPSKEMLQQGVFKFSTNDFKRVVMRCLTEGRNVYFY